MLILSQVDFRIMTWCWLMFLALDLNRRNINRGMWPAKSKYPVTCN